MPKRFAVAVAFIVLTVQPSLARSQALAAGSEATRTDDPGPEPARPADPPEHHLAEPSHSLADDLRRFASRENALVLGAGATLALLTASGDHALSRRLAASAVADRVFETGDVLGTGWLQAGGAVATYAVGKFAGKPAVAHVGVDLVRVQLLNGLLTRTFKLTAQRTRPDGGHYSFPSGHASASFATATVLGRRLGTKAGIPAFALATYVAISRVQEKRHFPSDVIFGAALGIVAGRTVTAAHATRGVALEPIVGPNGGVGLAVRLAWGPG